MGLSRRNVLIGLGGIVAGGGALVGTGAFTTVQAERTVNVQTAGDASAFLALTPAREDGAFVEQTNGTITINLDASNNKDADGLNQEARTRFENLVDVTNNGAQNVTTLELGVSVSTNGNASAHEEAFRVTVGNETLNPGNGNGSVDILGKGDNPDPLTPGAEATFGVEIDLLAADIEAIADDAEFTLTITANTSSS